MTPAHYAGAVTPWDLEKCMKSSGNAFVDARRTDAIEYCFRLKDDLLSDLKKARHCIDEAIAEMEGRKPAAIDATPLVCCHCGVRVKDGVLCEHCEDFEILLQTLPK